MDSGAANRLRRNVVRQLGLRAIVNLVTGADVTVLLLALGIDFPLMWGVLAFVLTFIPWSGLPLAVAPAVVLALAEYGLDRALLIIAGVIVINILAESALSPMPLTSNLLLLMVLLLRLLLSMVLSPRQKSSALNEHQCTTRDRGC
jgi:AI-2 transport protein TqsA